MQPLFARAPRAFSVLRKERARDRFAARGGRRRSSGGRPAYACDVTAATQADQVRVVLADDAVLLREGIARLLADAGFEVVGQSGTAEVLLLKVRSYAPDVAIVDIRMPPSHSDEGCGRRGRSVRTTPARRCSSSPTTSSRGARSSPCRECRGGGVPIKGPGLRRRRVRGRSAPGCRGRLCLRPDGGLAARRPPSPRRPASPT
jgi:hypothetical protein